MDVLNFSPFYGQFISALRYEQAIIEGKFHAFQFAHKCQGDLIRLSLKIEQIESIIAGFHKNGRSGTTFPITALVRCYQEGFLTGLREAVETVMLAKSRQSRLPFWPDSSQQVESDLSRRLLAMEGRFDAFSFAVACGGDLVRLERKVKKTRPLTGDLPANDDADTAVYHRSYLAGLRRVIAVITQTQN